MLNNQTAPYPEELEDLVEHLVYRPNWRFALKHMVRDEDSKGRGETEGLTFCVVTSGYDAYHPDRGQNYRVEHRFPVPAATYDRRAWRRWLLEQLLLVERHEACEFFSIEYKGNFTRRDGSKSDTFTERPFAPVHAPGADPYTITEVATDLERRTSYRGTVNE